MSDHYQIRWENFKFSDLASWAPVFGRWCGPGWSAGQRTQNTLDIKNKNVARHPDHNGESQVDLLCREHDEKYDQAVGKIDEFEQKLQADLELLKKLGMLNLNTLSSVEKDYVNLMKIAFPIKNNILVTLSDLAKLKALHTVLIKEIKRAQVDIDSKFEKFYTKTLAEIRKSNENYQKKLDPCSYHSDFEKYAESILGNTLSSKTHEKHCTTTKAQRKFIQDAVNDVLNAKHKQYSEEDMSFLFKNHFKTKEEENSPHKNQNKARNYV